MSAESEIIVNNPAPHWMEHLRPGDRVWLYKENCLGCVGLPYEAPKPGGIYGRIGVRHLSMSKSTYYDIQAKVNRCSVDSIDDSIDSWLIDCDGKGTDGVRLMLPTVSSCRNSRDPMSEQLLRTIEQLEARVSHLERISVASMFGFDSEKSEKT